MAGGLNELAASLGLDPLVPVPPADPAFSTVVRTQGRRPDSLAEALASLRDQTHPRHETILVVHHDDPEMAATVEAGLPPDVRPPDLRVIGAQGGGRSRPLNVGLDAATGDYVCFLDDDDLVTDSWITAFAAGAATAPGTVIRAVTLSEPWTTDGGFQPVRAIGPAERVHADHFDLLAHLSHNETPLCSVALPVAALRHFGLSFAEDLAVFEDWDLMMRVAQICGVTSIPDETSVYRRLDHGNADTEIEERLWHETHQRVIERLRARPVLVPAGHAHRIAGAHFLPGSVSRWQHDHDEAVASLDAVTRSPLRFGRLFLRRLRAALGRRFGRPRP